LRRKPAIFFGLAIAIFFATTLMACPSSTDALKAERIAKKFIVDRMTNDDGGILTSGKVRRIPFFPMLDYARLKSSGVLSESVGLAMLYSVRADDREIFDQQYKIASTKMLGQVGLFHWRISADGELVSDSSAIVDDLRIVGACLEAWDRWKQLTYRDFALEIAENIMKYEVVDGRLRDFVNWRDYGEHSVSNQIQLSYADTETMKRLANSDPAWLGVLNNTKTLFENGQSKTGLFFEKYNYDTGQFEGETQNVINQMYCALFAAEVETDGHPFADWMVQELKDEDKIYAQYNCRTGDATRFFESAAVYALAVRYAYKIGRKELAEQLLCKLLRLQNTNPLSRMYGGFFDDEVYSFDNLEAILALRAFNAGNVKNDGA
jgi:Glycosyl hydrolases family 8